MRERFRILLAGFDDVKRTRRAGLGAFAAALAGGIVEHRHVEFAIGVERTGIALLDANLELPFDLAGVGVYSTEIAFLGDDINRVAGQNGRTGRGRNVRRPKLKLLAFEHHRAGGGIRGRDIRNLQRHQLAGFIRHAKNGNELVVVMDDYRGVDAGAEQRDAPERFTGAGIDGGNAAITKRRINHAFAAARGDMGMRKGIILGPIARTRGPDEFAGLFVEGVKAVGGRAVRAPVGGDAARDDEVAINHRRCRARVREREPAKLLHERAFPEQFSVRGEARENSLRALDENIARLGINRGRSRGVTKINGVAEEIVVELLPELLAGFGVEADDTFLQIRAFAEIAHDVEPAVGDDGRGLAGKVRDPERMLRVNLVRQPGFA